MPSFIFVVVCDKVYIVISRHCKNKLIVLMSIMLEKRSSVYSFMFYKNDKDVSITRNFTTILSSVRPLMCLLMSENNVFW